MGLRPRAWIKAEILGIWEVVRLTTRCLFVWGHKIYHKNSRYDSFVLLILKLVRLITYDIRLIVFCTLFNQ